MENISRLREAEYRKQFSPCQWKEIGATNENLLFISTFADFSSKRRLISIFRVNWSEFASRGTRQSGKVSKDSFVKSYLNVRAAKSWLQDSSYYLGLTTKPRDAIRGM